MTTDTAARTKPSYLGLLNAISLGESGAGVYLKAWADVTPDPDLRQALALVASRETAHGEVFRQRIERLGFSLRQPEEADPAQAERLRLYGDPSISDVEKIRHGRQGQSEEDGGVNTFFASIDEKVCDESVDQLTRDTLRWYVHEERDSGELLRAAYARAEAKASAGGNGSMNSNGRSAAMGSSDVQALLACMTEGFTGLQQSIRELADALGRREKDKHK